MSTIATDQPVDIAGIGGERAIEEGRVLAHIFRGPTFVGQAIP